jgi:Putative MetA-pathway of phenol degradation
MMRLVAILLMLTLGVLQSPALAEEPSERTPAQEAQILVDKGGSMLARRTIVLEPGLEYTHISSNQLDITGFSLLPSLVIGVIQVERIRRDILVPSLTVRAGVTDAFEVNVRIPYSLRFDRFSQGTGADTVTKSVDEAGLGDIEGGFLVHLLKEEQSRPQVMLGLKIKSRTGKDPYGLATEVIGGDASTPGKEFPAELPLGSGHWALEPSLTLVRTVDPAVVFFNLSYFLHLERDIPGFGKIDPSDSIGYSFGMAYAINDKVAFSTAFDQKFFTKAERTVAGDARSIPNSNITIASLLIGGTYVLSDRLSVNLSVGIGMTEDAPDMQVGLKFPMRFSGF